MAVLETSHTSLPGADAAVAQDAARAAPPRRAGRWAGVAFQARYIAEKLIAAAVVLWLAASAAFLAVHLSPGDPVTLLMGEFDTPELRATIEAQWGLDRSLPLQYWDFLTRPLQGDFGMSYVQRVPVSDILFSHRLVASAQLTTAATIIAVTVALVVSVVSAGRTGIGTRITYLGELTFASIPTFWLGIVFITVLSFQLGLLPVVGGSKLENLVLPSLTLGLPLAAVLSQVLREGIERSLEQPYAVSALARGITPWQLKIRHGLRHALVPAATLAGWSVGGMLTGTVIVEQVFGRPGIGQATVVAVTRQDVPVVLGITLLAVALYVAVNTIVDIVYLWIDPRLRVR
ncbi:peptide/nickel transport system permease protein [Mycolicibacterium iranicum]|uniref:Peptide/nickel transport system permease protein n=1 Tax=Mycolicibacterium iranicum TaxID=912594 RepID=A0A839Q5U3_MYCIR|nr:ABC transporter permease [Mycolicibacterium iranicum]MBB2989745.1 peptide/nickel transport system permease protein [Mycolicibacterium iranicum]